MSQQTLFANVTTRTDAEGRRWWRPPHYLVLVLDADHQACGHEDDLDEIDCTKARNEIRLNGAYNDERNARGEVDDLMDLDYQAAAFDNWTGDWLIEPPAAWDVEPLAEGWTRYELRTAGAS